MCPASPILRWWIPEERNERRGSPRRRVPVWVSVALVISLALNLPVAGVIGGLAARSDGGDGGPRPIATLHVLGLGPLVLALDREGRDRLAGSVTARADDLDPGRQALGDATRSLVAALRADPFEPEAAAAALARQRAAVGELQALGHDLLVDYLAGADAATRARVADRIARHLDRRFPGED